MNKKIVTRLTLILCLGILFWGFVHQIYAIYFEQDTYTDLLDTELPITDGSLDTWYQTYYSMDDLRRQLDVLRKNPNQPNQQGLTPLMIATSDGNLEAVQLLLKHGADVNDRAGKTGFDEMYPENQRRTALHFAAFNAYPEILQVLLSYGADPFDEDSYKNLPIHLSMSQGDFDAQKVLLDLLMQAGSPLNERNNEHATLLQMYIEQDNIELVKYLIKRYGDFLNLTLKNQDDVNPYDYAIAIGREDIADLLTFVNNTVLGLQGNDVNERNAQGYAGVHLASIQGNPEYLKNLIARKADLNIKSIKGGNTALLYAARYNFPLLVEILLNNNASVLETNNQRKNIVMELRGIRDLNQRIMFLKRVLQMGARLNDADAQGNTVLHQAVLKHDTEWVTALVRNFKDLDTSKRNTFGFTALDIAKRKRYSDIVKILEKS